MGLNMWELNASHKTGTYATSVTKLKSGDFWYYVASARVESRT